MRVITLQPVFENCQMPRLRGQVRDRHLMRAPCALDWLSIDDLRSRPAFGRAQNDHGPDWKARRSLAAGLVLDGADFLDHCVERRRHGLVHWLGVAPLDEVGFVSVASEELSE